MTSSSELKEYSVFYIKRKIASLLASSSSSPQSPDLLPSHSQRYEDERMEWTADMYERVYNKKSNRHIAVENDYHDDDDDDNEYDVNDDDDDQDDNYESIGEGKSCNNIDDCIENSSLRALKRKRTSDEEEHQGNLRNKDESLVVQMEAGVYRDSNNKDNDSSNGSNSHRNNDDDARKDNNCLENAVLITNVDGSLENNSMDIEVRDVVSRNVGESGACATVMSATMRKRSPCRKHPFSMYRDGQLDEQELRIYLGPLCTRTELVNDLMLLRRRYFLDFDPYRWMSHFVSTYSKDTSERAERNARHQPVNYMDYAHLGNLIQQLATCSREDIRLRRLRDDASFMHTVFAYIASGNYRDDEVQRAHEFYRIFAAYVDAFDVHDYNGYATCNTNRNNNNNNNDNNNYNNKNINNNTSVRALYTHPRNNLLLLCPTLYKVLRQLRATLVNAIVVANDATRLISCRYDNDDNVRLMRRVALAFVAEMWDAESMTLLDSFMAASTTARKRVDQRRPKYVTGTACCGKTRTLRLLDEEWGWCTASRGDLGSFGGKSLSPAYVAALHMSLDYALRTYAAGMIGDRGPLDNYLWTFIMPALSEVARLVDQPRENHNAATLLLEERIADLLVSMFCEFIGSTQNNLTFGYHRDYDTLVMVDPYSSRVHQRMLSRNEDNDAHRARIPYYALVQNIVYWCAALVYGYPVLAMPYTEENNNDNNNDRGLCLAASSSLREDYNKLTRRQSTLVAERYGRADLDVAKKARETIAHTARATKDKVPVFLLNTTYQRAIGIHK